MIVTKTPEQVEKISGVPADKIRMLGDLFGRRDIRITSVWCMGFNQHSRGTAMNRLIHAVHLLSGHWGREGDGPDDKRAADAVAVAGPGEVEVVGPHERGRNVRAFAGKLDGDVLAL